MQEHNISNTNPLTRKNPTFLIVICIITPFENDGVLKSINLILNQPGHILVTYCWIHDFLIQDMFVLAVSLTLLRVEFSFPNDFVQRSYLLYMKTAVCFWFKFLDLCYLFSYVEIDRKGQSIHFIVSDERLSTLYIAIRNSFSFVSFDLLTLCNI